MSHEFSYPHVQPIRRAPVDAILVRPAQRSLVIASLLRCPARDEPKR